MVIKKNNIFESKRGYTLLELLIYIAVLSVMTVIVADTFIMLSKGQGNIEAKSELNSNLNFALEKIKRDVSAASALNEPFTAGGSSSVLDVTVGADSVKYALDNGRLTRQVGLQAPDYITSDKVKVSSLNFSRRENINSSLAKRRISLEIDIMSVYNSASPDWQYSQELKTTVNLNQDFAF
jgi:prepilin-type N-terminal cleavage/methylation domain-containing protein